MIDKIPLIEQDGELNPLANARIVISCKSCVFADYEDITQTGCKADMLSKLKDNGAEIIEACDQEKEFYLIKDRVCTNRRLNSWKEAIGKDKVIDELLEIARQEVVFSTAAEAIVYVHNSSKEDLYITLDSIYKEAVKPNKVSFVVSAHVKIGRMVSYIKSYPHTLPWTIEAIIDKTIDIRRSLDIFIGVKCRFPYYVTFLGGTAIRPGIFAEIKERLVDKMERFMYEKGDLDTVGENIHNEIVNTEIHKFLHGNTEIPIGQKIEGLRNEQA